MMETTKSPGIEAAQLRLTAIEFLEKGEIDDAIVATAQSFTVLQQPYTLNKIYEILAGLAYHLKISMIPSITEIDVAMQRLTEQGKLDQLQR